jgi:hypothetical protein
LVYDHSFQFNSFRWTVLFTYFDYFQYLSPHRYVELQIADIKLTAKYLKLRGDLWTVTADRKAIIEKQLHLQVELNTIHQSIRELVSGQGASGSSNQNRKMLLVLSHW